LSFWLFIKHKKTWTNYFVYVVQGIGDNLYCLNE